MRRAWVLAFASLFAIDAPRASADDPSPVPVPAPEPAPEAAPPPDPGSEVVPAPRPESAPGSVVLTDPPGATPDALNVCVPPPPPCWHGSVAVRYRLRATDDTDDQDAYAYLTVRYRDETTYGWSASVFGRLAYDFDGGGDSGDFYVFDSVDDTFDSRLTARLYHAWANWRPTSEVVEQVRIGRQWTEAGDGFTFDGVHATIRPRGRDSDLVVTAFAGIPAHLYEDAPEGDGIFGVGVSGSPWRWSDVRADVVHVDDENDVYGTERATLTSVEIGQRLSQNTRLRAWYHQLDEDPREAGAALDTFSPRTDASLRVRVHAQLIDEKQTVYDLDPYYAVTQDLEPYWDALVAGSKSLSRRVAVEVGAAARVLFDPGDEGTYNHEFQRVFATVSTTDWPGCGWGLSATAEWYGGDDEILAFGAAAEWKPSKRWRLSFGTDYSLWRTDIYADSERYDSRGYYVRASHRPNDRWRLDLSVRLEDDDFDSYATVTAGVRRDF